MSFNPAASGILIKVVSWFDAEVHIGLVNACLCCCLCKTRCGAEGQDLQ